MMTPTVRSMRGVWSRRVRKLFATRRRAVASVLSMMFLILFGSLATAMAISSRGNIRTAATHVHVQRAMAAAETGLVVAQSRLQEATARFVVDRSDMNGTYVSNLWRGTASGTITVLPSPSGINESGRPAGIAAAVFNAHAAESNRITAAGIAEPVMGQAPSGTDLSVFAREGWIFTPVIGVESRPEGDTPPPGYTITYAPLANGTDVRVIVTGFDFDYQRGSSEPIARTVSQDFRISKRIRRVVVSPTKVMLGKNVNVVGDVAARFTDVTRPMGDPLIMRSDFFGLDSPLDAKLNDLFAAISTSDVDGDNRLRIGHPVEGASIPSNSRDYNGDGRADEAFQDATGDGFVDEFDVFIRHFDTDSDSRVSAAEFTRGGNLIDGELFRLIDSANPDRNRNGLFGFRDDNRNGRREDTEPFLDLDPRNSTARDNVLGYLDNVVDRRDQYAKVRGRLLFRSTEAAWRSAQPTYNARLQGPVNTGGTGSARGFGLGDDALMNPDPTALAGATADLQNASNGQGFWDQVASQLGVGVNTLTTYNETKPATSTLPRYQRVDADNNNDGLPDNWASAFFEPSPVDSPNYSDWYYRPVFQNMTFRDVQIPVGLNALFRNCTFVGVTWVRTTTSNTHVLWGEYGKMQLGSDGKPRPYPPRFVYGDDGSETSYPTMLPSSARPPNQMILMVQNSFSPLDKADIPANQVASTNGYNNLPDPLIVNGRRVVDTKLVSNNVRFHDCLFVGSIVSDTPTNYVQARNKLQFTGSTRFTDTHPTQPDNSALNPDSSDRDVIARSSMMLPQMSVDLGTFNSPPTQSVELKGVIIAGVIDIRGNTTLDGALVMTFNPVLGQYPLVDVLGNPIGNPANFNASIGYFGPADGDAESLDPNTLPIVAGQRVVGWDTTVPPDGIPDVPSSQAQPPGSVAVPFNGYGRINLRSNPDMLLPNGLSLPLEATPLPATYREGRM
ncbi:MAG: hypothetical protein SFY95_00455 [Planctomycetota bacterium]|nr:hypothetical protein [Planctomycetota bacterium]